MEVFVLTASASALAASASLAASALALAAASSAFLFLSALAAASLALFSAIPRASLNAATEAGLLMLPVNFGAAEAGAADCLFISFCCLVSAYAFFLEICSALTCS